MKHNFKDLTNKRFGKLLVIRRVENDKNGKVRWLCQCDCGNEKIVLSGGLLHGGTQSCGCLWREAITSHQKSHTKIYKLWNSMMQRCYYEKLPAYHCYGGRGITVCPEWHNFENFYRDMGERPEKMSLDRIDNNKGYSKENCRWSSKKEQARNTRKNRIIKFRNEEKCVSEWAEILGVSCSTLLVRINAGWTENEIFSIPFENNSRARKITFNNKTQRVKDWAKELNIGVETINNRLRNGWTEIEALTVPILRGSQTLETYHKNQENEN